MGEYPVTLAEFEARFGTERACEEYLYRLRWPEGFVYKGWPVGHRLWKCGDCGYKASLTAGTIFQDTRKPLSMWFRAMWWVSVQKNGTSALGLQRVLGLGSYETAWTWLHKLRRAMVRPGRDRLVGRIEVDETYIGGPEPGKSGRGATGKTLVVIAAEAVGKGSGRIRMQCVPDASAPSLHGFIQACVEPGSTIHTDGWRGYNGIEAKGYTREVTAITGRKGEASELMPRVHRVASLLQRWLLGIHQGGVGSGQLGYYLDEFTFRFNRRKSRRRGLPFYRLVQQAVNVGPVPYAAIVEPGRVPDRNTICSM